MSSYRIVVYTKSKAFNTPSPYWIHKKYKAQKKSFFGLWYTINSNAYPMNGYYDTEDEAREAIVRHLSKTTVRIINLEASKDNLSQFVYLRNKEK